MTMSTPERSPRRVLIVEDDPRIRTMLGKGLRRAGFDATSVEDGATAVAYATAAEPFDLIVLDLGLPDIDGLDVMRRLRAARVETPIVILTARDAVADKITALNGGAQDYLTKPFSIEELLARVRLRLAETGTRPMSRPDRGAPADASAREPIAGRVLIIEDDERIAALLRKALGAVGVELVVAEDGEVGVFLATTEPYDAVILDVGLPGVDGFAVLARLRSERPSLPVVLLTGYDDPAVRRRDRRSL